MDIKEKLKYFLSYKTVREDRSEVNGVIKIVSVFDRPRLIVGGMLQSGGLVKKIWDKGIKKAAQEKQRVDQALVLGFGCGDCAFMIRKYYPEALITGVEIDEKVIEAAKSFFNLNKLKKLNIVIEDGAKFIKKTKDKYDLVIVDVYLGEKMPKAFKSKEFIKQIRKILNKDGMMVINHLFFKDYKKQAEEFIKTIETEFKEIKLLRTASNLLIFGFKKD